MFYHYFVSWNDMYWMTGYDGTEEYVIQSIVLPFIGKQIKLNKSIGLNQLLNFGNCSRLVICKTENKLTEEEIKKLRDLEPIGEMCTEEFIDKIRSDLSVLQSKSLISLATTIPKNQIFVIMAFDDKELDSTYKLAIKPVGDKFGYTIFRIDDFQDSSLITDQILSSIAESKIIIADMTRERPNCYYETGIAQALGKELILTIKKGERKHFDIAGYRFIEWETAAELKDKLEKRLDAIMKGPSTSSHSIKL